MRALEARNLEYEEPIKPPSSTDYTYYIKEKFSNLGIHIGEQQIHGMMRIIMNFETRGYHIEALNKPLLAVHKMAFNDSDRNALFDNFGVKESVVKQLIAEIPNAIVNKEFIVRSDPFNLLSIWLIHLSYIFIKEKIVRDSFIRNIAKYLIYKFFTSVVNNSFRVGVNEGVMTATIESLSNKFDIVRYGTWKRVIEQKCNVFIVGAKDDDSRGLHALNVERGDDYGILYAITDPQTRIRSMVVGIANIYYKLHAEGVSIKDRSRIGEFDGEKYITQATSNFDTTISSTFAELSSKDKFLDEKLIRFVVAQFPATTYPLVRNFLISITAITADQTRGRKLDETKQIDNKTIIVGIRRLVQLLIQSSYRYCIKENVSLSNKHAVYVKIKNIYQSSRISDPSLVRVKDSVGYIVDLCGGTAREATKSSLRLAFIMYVILKSMKYLKV